MQLFADESTPYNLIQHFRNSGIEVITVKEKGLSGAEDEKVLKFAVDNKLTLLTADLDFGNILLYPPATHLGVIVIRYSPRVTIQLLKVIDAFVGSYKNEDLEKSLIIIDKSKYRVRRF